MTLYKTLMAGHAGICRPFSRHLFEITYTENLCSERGMTSSNNALGVTQFALKGVYKMQHKHQSFLLKRGVSLMPEALSVRHIRLVPDSHPILCSVVSGSSDSKSHAPSAARDSSSPLCLPHSIPSFPRCPALVQVLAKRRLICLLPARRCMRTGREILALVVFGARKGRLRRLALWQPQDL